MLLVFDDDNDLKWAVGATGRTTFVWTLAPPGTKFWDSGTFLSETSYLSIFKWTYPLWSAYDIAIDAGFIEFLQIPHTRKEYNLEFRGEDFDSESYMLFRRNKAHSLPLGNHVIAICQAAGILERETSGCFRLKPAFTRRKRQFETVDSVLAHLQQYLEKVQISRAEVEQRPKYREKMEKACASLDRSERNKILRYKTCFLALNAIGVWRLPRDGEEGLQFTIDLSRCDRKLLQSKLDDHLASIHADPNISTWCRKTLDRVIRYAYPDVAAYARETFMEMILCAAYLE